MFSSTGYIMYVFLYARSLKLVSFKRELNTRCPVFCFYRGKDIIAICHSITPKGSLVEWQWGGLLFTRAQHFRMFHKIVVDYWWIWVESDRFHTDHGKPWFQSVRISSAACHISKYARLEEGLSTETAQPEADEKPKEVEVVIIPCGKTVGSDAQGSSPNGCMVIWSKHVKPYEKDVVRQPQALTTFLLDLYPS